MNLSKSLFIFLTNTNEIVKIKKMFYKSKFFDLIKVNNTCLKILFTNKFFIYIFNNILLQLGNHIQLHYEIFQVFANENITKYVQNKINILYYQKNTVN